MAISVVVDSNSAKDTRALSLACGSLAVGDIVVILVGSEDSGAANRPGAPTNASCTVTSRVVDTTTNFTYSALYTAVVNSAGSITFACAAPGQTCLHAGVAVVFPTADGYSLATTPNTVDARGSGAPSGTITSTAGSILVCTNGDWAAINGASRTYRGTVTEDGYAFLSGIATRYFWHQTAGSSSTTVGLTAPTGQTFTVVGIEVLFSGGGGGAALPPDLVMAPIRS